MLLRPMLMFLKKKRIQCLSGLEIVILLYWIFYYYYPYSLDEKYFWVSHLMEMTENGDVSVIVRIEGYISLEVPCVPLSLIKRNQ